jgi:hypothetical protein
MKVAWSLKHSSNRIEWNDAFCSLNFNLMTSIVLNHIQMIWKFANIQTWTCHRCPFAEPILQPDWSRRTWGRNFQNESPRIRPFDIIASSNLCRVQIALYGIATHFFRISRAPRLPRREAWLSWSWGLPCCARPRDGMQASSEKLRRTKATCAAAEAVRHHRDVENISPPIHFF